VVHLEWLERVAAGKRPFELCTQLGQLECVIHKLVEGNILRLISRNPKHRVEGLIARLHAQVRAEHDDRVGDRVEDRLGVFAFINGLSDACAESGHVGEREHRADLAFASYEG
jgi:hypothetical protein